jgi:hypothetical protein
MGIGIVGWPASLVAFAQATDCPATRALPLQERTKDAQFVIISLRNNMFELADRLVGIYKTNNHTKTVTINPHNIQLTAA